MLLYLFGGSFVVFRESFVEYCFFLDEVGGKWRLGSFFELVFFLRILLYFSLVLKYYVRGRG